MECRKERWEGVREGGRREGGREEGGLECREGGKMGEREGKERDRVGIEYKHYIGRKERGRKEIKG